MSKSHTNKYICIKMVRQSVYNDDLKVGDLCKVTETMWYSSHKSALIIKPDGSEFWYNKCQFKTLEDIRNDKLNDIGI